MSERAKALRGARVAIHKQMTDVLEDASKDPAGLTGERKQKYDAMRADFTVKTDELRAQEDLDRDAAELNAPQEVVIGGEDRSQNGEREKRDTADKAHAEKRSNAFDTYMRRGMTALDLEQRKIMAEVRVESRDLTTATGSSGGFTIPQGFLAKITQRQKYFGPMRQLANKITTESGQDLPWPNNDDTGTVASVLGENSTIAEADPVFGHQTLKAKVWTSGLVKAPLALVNDSAFDLQAWLAGIFGKRFGRGQNTAFSQTTGTSVTLGLLQGLIAGAAQTATTATAGGLLYTYADLVKLKHAVDPAYRATAAWQMSDTALQGIELLVDTTGRPLFFPAGTFGSISDAKPDTILGQPLYINNDLPVPAASAVGTIVYGDMEAAYLIRDVLDIQMVALHERYADSLEVGFFAFARTDGITDDTYAAAYMTNHS